MPRTTNGGADHKSLRERSVIVAAMGVDGEYLGTGADEHNTFIAYVPQQGLAGEVVQGNALREVRPSGLGLLFSHSPSPPLSW